MKYYSANSIRHVRLIKLICLSLVSVAAWVTLTGCKSTKPVYTEPTISIDIQLPPIPRPEKFASLIVVPPSYTNLIVQLDWNPSWLANGYYASIGTNKLGTNFIGTIWKSYTEGTTVRFNIRILDNAEFIYATVYATNNIGVSGNYFERDPAYQPNAIRLSVMQSGKSAQIQVSQDFKSWINTYSGNGPWTNVIQYDKNQYFRAITAAPPVALNIEPLRLWNKDHYGAD